MRARFFRSTDKYPNLCSNQQREEQCVLKRALKKFSSLGFIKGRKIEILLIQNPWQTRTEISEHFYCMRETGSTFLRDSCRGVICLFDSKSNPSNSNQGKRIGNEKVIKLKICFFIPFEFTYKTNIQEPTFKNLLDYTFP